MTKKERSLIVEQLMGLFKISNTGPISQQISQFLRQSIQSGMLAPGTRLPNTQTLADIWGVNNGTVHTAMGTLTSEGLLTGAPGRGRHVQTPPTLKSPKIKRHVALLFGYNTVYPKTTFWSSRLAEQLELFFALNEVSPRIYRPRWYPMGEGPDPAYDEFVENLDQGRISGIVTAYGPFPDRWSHMLMECSLPRVGTNFPNQVTVSYEDMLRQGIKYLASAGRRKIACISHDDPMLTSANDRQMRLRHSQILDETLKAHDLRVHDRWLRGDFRASMTGAGYCQFREIWAAEREKPDGLLVMDDVLFSDTTKAILELGIRVPDQLLIVTHANKGSGMFYPFPVARMETDVELYAQTLGDMLLRLIRGEKVEPARTVLPFRWLDVNASAGEGDGQTDKENMKQAISNQ